MTDLTGKHAVITGGGSGIGLAIAKSLNEHGANISLMARNLDRLQEAAKGLNNASAIAVDITSESAVAKAFEGAVNKFGPIDILVNNAGIAETAPLRKTSLEMWQRIMDVNLTGTFLCSKAALNSMTEGRIINIASTSGLKAYAYTSAYTASKHGVIGLTKTMALELGKSNITVNAICPGFTNTAIVGEALDNIIEKTGRTREEALMELTKDNPEGRLIEPEEIAEMVLWLCSKSAQSTTGQALAIAGGKIF